MLEDETKGGKWICYLPSTLVGSEIDEVLAIDGFESHQLIFLNVVVFEFHGGLLACRRLKTRKARIVHCWAAGERRGLPCPRSWIPRHD